MKEAIIDGVHRIANHIYKKKGHLVTIKREDVATTLEAFILLSKKIKEDGNNKTNIQQTD